MKMRSLLKYRAGFHRNLQIFTEMALEVFSKDEKCVAMGHYVENEECMD